METKPNAELYDRIIDKVVETLKKHGDEYTFDVPEGLDVESVRSAACGWASKTWGGNTYSSKVDFAKRTFTIVRHVEPIVAEAAAS